MHVLISRDPIQTNAQFTPLFRLFGQLFRLRLCICDGVVAYGEAQRQVSCARSNLDDTVGSLVNISCF